MTRVRSLFLLVAAMTAGAGSAFGWGCEGHQMIALIARAHLTPAASAAVDQLLRQNPIDPALKRFCKDRPDDPLADSATWADDRRSAGDIADWHYVDIPMGVLDGSAQTVTSEYCKPLADGKPGCVISALNYEIGVLRDEKQPAPARADALRYVTHFTGDITQPLHTLDHRGANCTSVLFLSEDKPDQLHSLWDTKIIKTDMTAKQQDRLQYAGSIDAEFAQYWTKWGESKPDTLAWTWDSHKYVGSAVYGNLKPALPMGPPSELKEQAACDEERAAAAALHIRIGDDYIGQAVPVIRQQLAKAGYRLAALLNETFK